MKNSSSTSSLGRSASTGRRRRRGQEEADEPVLGDKTVVFPFDLGVFHVVAEQYRDKTYADLAATLMDRAPPGSLLRSTAVKIKKAAAAKQPTSKFGRAMGGSHDPKKDPEKSVIFHLPRVDEHGGMNWDLSTFTLPTGRDKESREARKQLFKYVDSSGDGSIRLNELKSAFAGMVTVPGKMDARTLVNHGLDRAFLAVQELMLDGMNPSKEEAESISGKEFRVFLIFFQRYLELYEIFSSIDNSDDQMISVEEFTRALPKLETWGLNDPSISKNPELAFRKMDKDNSGEVSFPEFAEFCIRQGLIEEVEKEIRTKDGH
mmetsp:Transcript_148086/g.261101  ORF Transcript_148086/g.261101 Transcript_148086/m.261101 type:complete len:319 (-) Transcript_148086:60-1016(-)